MQRQAIKPGPAALKLAAFIEERQATERAAGRRLTLRDVADALRVTHPALIGWLKGISRPKAQYRGVIAIWTGDAVPEDSWLTAEERKQFEGVSEYRPGSDPTGGAAV